MGKQKRRESPFRALRSAGWCDETVASNLEQAFPLPSSRGRRFSGGSFALSRIFTFAVACTRVALHGSACVALGKLAEPTRR